MSVVLLGAEHQSTWIVANALHKEFKLRAAIIEKRMSRLELARRRTRRLGWCRVGGQILFQLLVPLLENESAARAVEIAKDADFCTQRPSGVEVSQVTSANAPEAIALLGNLAPSVVVVNGTRILSREVLQCTAAPFINTHAGITPKYRGVHGGYWALASRDPSNMGVSVHLVDAGIDSGNILYQSVVRPTHRDNFATYPLLQLAAGLPLLIRAVRDALDGSLRPVDSHLPSALYSHPTLWAYLSNRFRLGVK